MVLRRYWLLMLLTVVLPLPEAGAFSPTGRESREQRRENTQHLRDMLASLYRASALAPLAAEDQEHSQRIVALIVAAQEIWPRVMHRLSEARAAAIALRFDQTLQLAQSDAKRTDLIAPLEELVDSILESFKVITTPAQTPNLELGQQVFRTSCASCHGQSGGGDGILAPNLQPKPTSFTADGYITSLSPFAVFNLNLRGIAGQAKNSFEHLLTPHEMWSVAFYVIAMPHSEQPTNPDHHDVSWFAKQGGSLQMLASMNDHQLLRWLSQQMASSSPTAPASAQGYLAFLRRQGVFRGELFRIR